MTSKSSPPIEIAEENVSIVAPRQQTVAAVQARGSNEDAVALYRLTPERRMASTSKGISAQDVHALASRMGIDHAELVHALRLSGLDGTADRRGRRFSFPPLEAERVIGLTCMIGQVQSMVEESGVPNGFDAAPWLGQWLQAPLPALGGLPALNYLHTAEGQQLVSTLLAMTQSGAYA